MWRIEFKIQPLENIAITVIKYILKYIQIFEIVLIFHSNIVLLYFDWGKCLVSIKQIDLFNKCFY